MRMISQIIHFALTKALPLSLLFHIPHASAANLYIFKDKDGNALLTNVVGRDKKPKGELSQYSSQVKVTWYPDTNVHAYRNWGGSEASVLPSYSRNRNAYDDLITNAASTFGVDQGLVKAIMHTESGFNPSARSPVGAQGLMQLMPATARRFFVNDSFDPAQNISGGVKYLNFLLKRYNNNHELAIAAYNAGEGNVDKYHGIPPFRETQDYVKRVMSRFNNLYSNGIKVSASSTSSNNGSESNLGARSRPIITYTNADGSASATFTPTSPANTSAFGALRSSAN
ncbi:lytic transglycosylase domain-containing protein [Aquirhabdus parva]|uniref:Lytic transglycosylase domain-containing protein n=1 Tax=Aquirhabdus parva TaxID=2283318 RepID=A0A345P607_9GAMM|nr:lytic transglycosylase domain-containing protein [Aquirhabdus parva]AXI02716.1 lytic transglycosylase domain-containing protein [Aquirhabdus parva]